MEEKPTFDGFDYLGRSTGKKCFVCIHQQKECEFQCPYGEGAFLICLDEQHKYCIKDNEETNNI